LKISSAKAREGGAPSVRLRRGAIPSVDATGYRDALRTSVEDCFRWRALAERLSSKDEINSESSSPKGKESTSVLSLEALESMEKKRPGCVSMLTGFPDFGSIQVLIINGVPLKFGLLPHVLNVKLLSEN
jgi:hypothetical protein